MGRAISRLWHQCPFYKPGPPWATVPEKGLLRGGPNPPISHTEGDARSPQRLHPRQTDPVSLNKHLSRELGRGSGFAP